MTYSPILNPHPVSIAAMPSTPVTGTFWQATQPVSIAGTVAVSGPLTDTQLRATPLPVSGTFWQATQPISGNVGVTGSVAVTGTFWQATQPVSLASLPALTAGAAVIGALTANQSVNQTQVNGVAVLTGNGVSGTGAQRVAIASDQTAFSVNALQSGAWNIGSITTLPALAAGSAVIGKVGIDQTTVGTTNAVSLAQIGAAAVATGNGVVGTGVQRVAIASDNTAFSVNAAPPALTKGTQGALGVSTQELKDAGRLCLAMTAEFTFAQVAETLLTMTISADGGATSTFGSRVITSGKKFRIQSATATIESLGSGTAPQRACLRLRRNTAGATIASSPLQAVWGFVNSTAVVKSGFSMDYEVPDALEMNGDGTATFGFTLETPDWVTSTATGRIKITVIGFEY